MCDTRQQHALAFEMLEQSLRDQYGISLSEEVVALGKYGKPYLHDHPEIQFSISHCRRGVALSLGACRTGIDLEIIRHYDADLAKKILSPTEYEYLNHSENPNLTFFQFWTLKESYLKALGTGLQFALNRISFTFEDNHTIRCNRKIGHFQRLDDIPGFAVSVCNLEHRICPDSMDHSIRLIQLS